MTVRNNPAPEDMLSPVSYFLLLLDERAFGSAAESEGLSTHVRSCMQAGRPHALVIVHWTEVQFEHFLTITPSDLLLGGIYHNVAVPLFPPGPLQPVSFAMIATRLGGEADHSRFGVIKRTLRGKILAPRTTAFSPAGAPGARRTRRNTSALNLSAAGRLSV